MHLTDVRNRATSLSLLIDSLCRILLHRMLGPLRVPAHTVLIFRSGTDTCMLHSRRARMYIRVQTQYRMCSPEYTCNFDMLPLCQPLGEEVGFGAQNRRTRLRRSSGTFHSWQRE